MVQNKISNPQNSILTLCLVLAAVFFMLVINSWNAKSCFIPDEMFYYKSSQSLANFKNVFAPLYYGEPRFQKPPVFYIAVFLAMKAFGVNWFSARIVTILASIAVLIVTYMLGLKMFDAKKSLFAVIILSTSTLFFQYGRMAIPEMLLVLCITSAFYFAYRYFTDNTGRYFYMAFIMMGAGILVKGPMAILLPTTAMLIFYYMYKPLKHVPFIRWVWGVCIALGLGLLWFIPAAILHGNYFLGHIMNAEVSDRFTAYAGSPALNKIIWFHIQKLLFYVPAVIVEYFPWSIVVPAIFIFGKDNREVKENNIGRVFLLIWAMTGFIMFSLISAKRMHYVLSFLPALSLYSASLVNFKKNTIKNIFISIASVAVCIYVCAALVVFPLMFSDGVDRLSMKMKDLAGASDHVGVSWNIGSQRLELYIDKRVHAILEHEFNEKEFPNLNISWMLVTENEYRKYLFPAIPRNEIHTSFPAITLIAEDWRWRRKIPFKECVSGIKKDPSNAVFYLKDAFQEKVYLLKVGKYG